MTEQQATTDIVPYLEAKKEWERRYWLDAFGKCHFKMTELSRATKLNRPSLYKKLESLGMSPTTLRELYEQQSRPTPEIAPVNRWPTGPNVEQAVRTSLRLVEDEQ